MRLLHITETAAPIGGIETYLLNLVPLLEERGAENAIIFRNNHPLTPTDLCRRYFVPGAAETDNALDLISEVVEQENPDIICLHAIKEPQVALLAKRRAPTIAYVHGFMPVCPGQLKLFRRGISVCTRPFGLGCIPMIYMRRCATARHPVSVHRIMKVTQQFSDIYKQLDGIFVASSYMQQLLVQNGFEPRNLIVLPYFVPPDSDYSHYFSAPDRNPPRILFAGRLVIEKGLSCLLRALSYIDVPFKLVIAGDGSLRSDYKALALKLGLAERVEFMGWLGRNELHEAIQVSSLVVMPSVNPEPYGIVGIEAMAHGRPVVAFDSGGISDWLKHDYSGLLVPNLNVEKLASAVDQLLRDEQLALQFGANGKKYVEQHFSPEQYVDRFLSSMTSIIKQKQH